MSKCCQVAARDVAPAAELLAAAGKSCPSALDLNVDMIVVPSRATPLEAEDGPARSSDRPRQDQTAQAPNQDQY
jgi:hypothetical protein